MLDPNPPPAAHQGPAGALQRTIGSYVKRAKSTGAKHYPKKKVKPQPKA
jgi:hypothetical protein